MRTPEISWNNFTHPNLEAIQKREAFLNETVKKCINCTHFYINENEKVVCDASQEYFNLKSKCKFFELKEW